MPGVQGGDHREMVTPRRSGRAHQTMQRMRLNIPQGGASEKRIAPVAEPGVPEVDDRLMSGHRGLRGADEPRCPGRGTTHVISEGTKPEHHPVAGFKAPQCPVRFLAIPAVEHVVEVTRSEEQTSE